MSAGIRSLLAFWLGGGASAAITVVILPTPEDRILKISREKREFAVKAEDRKLAIEDDRMFKVTP